MFITEDDMVCEPFTLTSPDDRERARRNPFPKSVVAVEVAPPPEEAITITVTVVNARGKKEKVLHAWLPSTGEVKKLSKKPWKKLGIDRGLGSVRTTVARKARAEHLRRVKQYASYDLFPGQGDTDVPVGTRRRL